MKALSKISSYIRPSKCQSDQHL